MISMPMKAAKSILTRNVFFGSLLFILGSVLRVHGQIVKQVQFPSTDGLEITADLYVIDEGRPYMVLCHLAGHSRGEYTETAKKLNSLGYNCLAMDARSGFEVFGIMNETARRAVEQDLSTNYLDAEQDIIAAICYTDSISGGKGAILLGSSYSAALALKIGATHPKVTAVIAFSPGEYFEEKLVLKDAIRQFDKPLFVTSSKKEVKQVTTLINEINMDKTKHFIPKGEGAHGSIALWDMVPNHMEYWQALQTFLEERL